MDTGEEGPTWACFRCNSIPAEPEGPSPAGTHHIQQTPRGSAELCHSHLRGGQAQGLPGTPGLGLQWGTPVDSAAQTGDAQEKEGPRAQEDPGRGSRSLRLEAGPDAGRSPGMKAGSWQWCPNRGDPSNMTPTSGDLMEGGGRGLSGRATMELGQLEPKTPGRLWVPLVSGSRQETPTALEGSPTRCQDHAPHTNFTSKQEAPNLTKKYPAKTHEGLRDSEHVTQGSRNPVPEGDMQNSQLGPLEMETGMGSSCRVVSPDAVEPTWGTVSALPGLHAVSSRRAPP